MNNPYTFTRAKILRAARTLARRHGIDRVLKRHVAEHLGCATGTINTHFGTMQALRDAVVDDTDINDTSIFTGRARRK
jgi:AcrR family transcriptional regulator